MSPHTARIVSTEPLSSEKSKWLKLVKINYLDGAGNPRTWEAMRRPTKPEGSVVDAIQILAILEKASGPELLLEKQFRPPTGKVVVELPAGMVDEGETPEEAALRELREETGYVGEIISSGEGAQKESGLKWPVMWNSPASSSSTSFVIRVKIDLEKKENQSPKPQLEEGEFIECFSIPLKELYAEVRRLEAEGYAIDGKIGAIAEALELARTWQ